MTGRSSADRAGTGNASLAARIARATILHPAVQVAILLWAMAYLAVLLLADGTLPFDRPALADQPFALQLAFPTFGVLVEGWSVFDNARDATLSLIFVFLGYFGPGMIKTFITLRTGNAWVHAIGYHAIAPHVVVDTPLIVKAFGLR